MRYWRSPLLATLARLLLAPVLRLLALLALLFLARVRAAVLAVAVVSRPAITECRVTLFPSFFVNTKCLCLFVGIETTRVFDSISINIRTWFQTYALHGTTIQVSRT